MNPLKTALLLPALACVSISASAGEVTIGANRDNTLYSGSGSESNGAGEFFFAGSNGFGQVRRALLRFDVALALPPGATVTQAEVILSMSKTNAGLRDVQSWLDSPSTNFGWLVKNVNEDDVPTAKRFDSRQNAVPSERPILRIFFDPPCTAYAANYCVGVPNSTGVGATIGWSGSLSVSANAFTLACTQLPPNASHVYFFGPSQAQAPFGNGFRCVTGVIARLNPPQVATASGTSSRYVDLTTIPAVGNITVGSTRYFQCWYRNPAGGGAGFNLSNGLGATFCN